MRQKLKQNKENKLVGQKDYLVDSPLEGNSKWEKPSQRSWETLVNNNGNIINSSNIVDTETLG